MERWSPVRFASGMNTPMLVVHGERDYRVPVGQGLLIYGVLKAKGVPGAARLLPGREPLGLEAAQLAALVPRGARVAGALVEGLALVHHVRSRE